MDSRPYCINNGEIDDRLKGDAVGIIITPNQRAPYVERFTLALMLPRLLFIGQLGLIGGFGIMIIGLVELMHNTPLPPNPFTRYADVLPGETNAALRTHGFTCWLQDYNHNEPTESRCGVNLKTGMFSHVETVYSRGVIHQITFDVRDEALSVGDLAVMLELSDIEFRGVVLFAWRGKMGLARLGNPANHVSVFRKVWTVTLTDTPHFGS